jgi:TetR/AcrR family transcriptional regulator, fatty acid metabolism regulator protein
MRSKQPDKHQRILDAAVKIFAGKGFFQARVSEIAREARVADGTVYLYFKSKDDLLIAIFEVKMREVIQRFRETVSELPDAPSRLMRLVELHLGGFQANPDLAAVFQVELRQSYRFMREYAKGELKEYLDLIGEIVEQGRREGVFRDDLPVSLMKRFIFGAIDEVVSTWVMSGMKYDLTGSARHLVDLFFQGMVQRPQPSPCGERSGSGMPRGGSHETPGG